jgi:hypothetical protein
MYMSKTKFVIIFSLYIGLFVAGWMHKTLTKKIEGPYERLQRNKISK